MHPKPAARPFATAVLLASLASAQAAPPDVAVTLTPERQSLGKNDNVIVKLTFTNVSSHPVRLLKWRLPGPDTEAPLFEITRDGVQARYLGMMIKRAAPTADDYITLQPGASRTAQVELSALYEMNVTGAYTVRYRSGAVQLFGAGGAQRDAVDLASIPVSIWIDGRLPRGTLPPEPQPVSTRGGAGLAFSRCSNAQQGEIGSAANAALAMATDGEAYMAKAALAARYGQWFGALDAERAAKVRTHFTAIRDVFANRQVTVDCGCDKPDFAYVYPWQSYVIHVCKAFWNAPLAGTDSKGGTLVHEMSHFWAVAGTWDWAYGQDGAAALAAGDPASAVANADSHEYFGENTPELKVK